MLIWIVMYLHNNSMKMAAFKHEHNALEFLRKHDGMDCMMVSTIMQDYQ